VSSHQLDDQDRGFSFREGAPLDMRMGTDARQSAAELLNEAPDHQLLHLFREYADERKAPRLVREIVKRRATVSFATSDHLVNAIRGALGPRSGPGDFARIFQAIRIEVNDELGALARALPALRDRLAPGGTMAVIAYHSGEDRVVKHAFRDWSNPCTCPPRQPLCICGAVALGESVHRRAVTASERELAANPRARSARLRAWRRVA
jgi:16S rRNA (cytosine1402-N4)-methyltransferase